MKPATFSYSVVSRASDIRPKSIEITWPAFVESLATPALRGKPQEEYLASDDETKKRLKDGKAAIFARFEGEGRTDKNVVEVTAIGLDLDNGSSREIIESKLNGYTYAAHTTYSHSGAAEKWRIVLPFAEPMPSDILLPVFRHFQSLFGGKLDEACKNPSRLYYLPACPPNAASQYTVFAKDGTLFDPLSLKSSMDKTDAQSAVKQAITGLKQGERNVGIFRYACKLRAVGTHENEARRLVLEAGARCVPPLDEDEALRCLESAWRYDANFHTTDLGNAQRLVAHHGEDIRYCPDFKKWLIWDGLRWCFDEDGAVMRRAKDTVRSIYAETANETNDTRRAALAKHAVASESAGRLAAMVELAKSEAELVARSSEFDADPMLLGVGNGTVNLLTGGLWEPRREDYITKQAMTHYDPAAQCPLWLSFLNRIMGGDTEMIGFLQRAMGYALTGSAKEQCLFLLYGVGANGKSTFLNVIGELAGDYGANTPAESLMVQQNSGVRNDIARLRGVRFVTAIETEDGQRLAESLVKSLTGGDTISARFLYGEFFDFTPQFKLFLAANHKPVIKGDDYAIWRRVRLVPFEVTVPEGEQDRDLPEKLRAELPGILNWAIEGCHEWIAQGCGLRLRCLQRRRLTAPTWTCYSSSWMSAATLRQRQPSWRKNCTRRTSSGRRTTRAGL